MTNQRLLRLAIVLLAIIAAVVVFFAGWIILIEVS